MEGLTDTMTHRSSPPIKAAETPRTGACAVVNLRPTLFAGSRPVERPCRCGAPASVQVTLGGLADRPDRTTFWCDAHSRLDTVGVAHELMRAGHSPVIIVRGV